MSYFLKNGTRFSVSSKQNLDLHELLPAGNYVLKFDQTTSSFYLDMMDAFTLPSKLYGNTNNYAQRIFNTFMDRPATTGVLLVGEKGSGKTLLSKKICLLAYENEVPTIVINTPFNGDNFNKFLQTIEQPAIILFDEFEKVYSDTKDQEAILTLLDGVFPSKKLFILTSNSKYKIDYNMKNRPGRIYYMMSFDGLEPNFVKEYCEDVLVNKSYTEQLCKLCTIFQSFNFDMLKAIVEEMNRYGESPQEVLKVLNAKPETEGEFTYKVHFKPTQPDVDLRTVQKTIHANPLMKDISLFFTSMDDGPSEDYKEYYANFTPNDIKRIEDNKYFYENIDGEKMVLEKEVHKPYNYYNAL